VHLGHQALLSACRELAAEKGCKSGVITFTSHPDTLVLGKTPALLNTPEDRDRLLRQFSMDCVISLPFDEAMMTMPWEAFLTMLTREYGAAGLVCGSDFRFGYKGQGNCALLEAFCAGKDIPCAIVPEQTVDGIRVSSTHIRSLLDIGAMEEAVRFLGHPHILTGTVIPGRKLGRTIGIPTANLAIPRGVLAPKFGVYACRACFDGQKYPAVTNIGTRPTVDGQGITVEPWILDFDGDLYGKEITLEFFRFLRPEQKFDSLDALKTEIEKNALQTRAFFGK